MDSVIHKTMEKCVINYTVLKTNLTKYFVETIVRFYMQKLPR